MCSSALLFGRFDDSQESRFQASKRSNMGSAVLEGGRSADIHEFIFQAAGLSDMDCVELQWFSLLIVRNGIFKSRNVQIIAVPSCKRIECCCSLIVVSECETVKYVQCVQQCRRFPDTQESRFRAL